MKKWFVGILLFSFSAVADIKTEDVEYKQGSQVLQGFVAYDASLKGPRPAVVIIHNWMGMADYSKRRAKELAELGYVAFAADIYGKEFRPKNSQEAGALAGKFKGDRKLLRSRALAAVDAVKKIKHVDSKKISAMGYCFGGTTALEMALAGLPLTGTISFHGGLEFPSLNQDAKKIKTKLLVLHGAIDPHVPPAQVSTFVKAMDEAKVDYQFVSYSGAVHAFTEPEAGNDISKGAAYNEAADRRSFEAMKDFLAEVNR